MGTLFLPAQLLKSSQFFYSAALDGLRKGGARRLGTRLVALGENTQNFERLASSKRLFTPPFSLRGFLADKSMSEAE